MSGTQPTSENASPKETVPTFEWTAFLEPDFAWMNWADEIERMALNDDAHKEQLVDAKDGASQSSQPFVDISKVPTSPPFVAIVLNLPFDTSEEDLANFFSGIKIACVQLVHQNDGNMVGASYVEFRDRDSLICALQRTGKSLNNRTIRVEVFCGSAKDRRFGDGHGRRAYADGGKGGSAYRGRRSSEASSTRNDRDSRQLLRRAQMPNDVRATDYARRTNSVDHPPSERDNRYNSLPRGYVGRYGSHDAAGVASGPSQLTERHQDTFTRGGGGFSAGKHQDVPYCRSMSKSEGRQGPRSMHERPPYRYAGNQSTADIQFDRYHGGANVAPGSSYRQRRSSAQSDSERCLGLHPDRASYDASRARGGPGKFDRHYGSLNRNRMGQGHRFGRQDDSYYAQNFGRNRFADSWRTTGEQQQHETIPKQEGAAEANVSTESADLPKSTETTAQQERTHLPYSSIFGEAKPVDTERRVREIEQQRLAMLRQESVQSVPPNMGSSKRPSNAFVLEPDNTGCDRYDEEALLASGEIKLLRRPTPRKEEVETIAASQTSHAAEPHVEHVEQDQTVKTVEDTYRPRGWSGGASGRASRRSRGHRGGRRGGGIGRGSYVRGYGSRSNRQNSRIPLEPQHDKDGNAPSLQAAAAVEQTSVSDARRSSNDKNDCVQSFGSVTRTESRASSISNGRDGYRFEHIIEFRRGGSRSVSTTRLTGPGESAKSERTAAPVVGEGQTADATKREKVAQEAGEPSLVAATSTGAARANKPKEDRYPAAAAGRHGRGKANKRNAKSNGRQAFTDKNKFDLLKSFVCDD
ncbi:eukaryotic translation initiation factor 4B [Trichuris trichiura]|uniref:Eukaryotic translation initiation factor 4B n=1 Tax=Trichuris trichiura TaxID=36087 RepID=A0A077Z8G0_TRITR|nr:eukaryotic translation initiation factor 4B [Trichuris trichiura]